MKEYKLEDYKILENQYNELKTAYFEVLKDYHIISDLLEKERYYNNLNNRTIQDLNEIIEKYKSLLEVSNG